MAGAIALAVIVSAAPDLAPFKRTRHPGSSSALKRASLAGMTTDVLAALRCVSAA